MDKVYILGYGKMGKRIHELSQENKVEIVGFTSDPHHDFTQDDAFLGSDVVIEFTSPHSAVSNLMKCLEKRKPVVTGSTGWYQQLDLVKKKFMAHDGSLFYASNFSIGANILFAMNKILAQIMDDKPEYGLTIEETHHTEKLDAPSGTAMTLADDIIASGQRFSLWTEDETLGSDEEFRIISYREENVKGTHIVNYNSSVDRIFLGHEAFSRDGFATGALKAAKWLIGKKGVFSMDDMLKLRE